MEEFKSRGLVKSQRARERKRERELELGSPACRTQEVRPCKAVCNTQGTLRLDVVQTAGARGEHP